MQIGDSFEARFTIGPSDSSAALEMAPEDSFPNVFATARMITFMEIAATRLMRPLLKEGEHSVGVLVSVKHTAATPIGAEVHTVATYLGQEGKLFRFKVEAFDDAGPIGAGEHTRAIVTTSRLLAGAEKRRASLRRPSASTKPATSNASAIVTASNNPRCAPVTSSGIAR